MTVAKNPTEKVMDGLEQSWLDASKDAAGIRLFIWRVPTTGESLLNGFLSLQQHPEGRTLPDLFVGLNTPFETAYGYSEALGREFVEHYEATPDAATWPAESHLPCYSPAQLSLLLQHFAGHFSDHLRYLVLSLNPSDISDGSALMRWFNGWLAQKDPAPRLLLVDTVEHPMWQSLHDAHPDTVRLIEDPVDGMKVMQQSAQQNSGNDTDMLQFRRYLADTMLLLENGSAAQVAERGAMPLAIAQQRGWYDQQVMVHNLIAGGWLKSGDHTQAIEHYQLAQQASGGVSDPLMRGQLRTQSIFGEAGVWFAQKDYLQSANTYRQAALEAQAVPHPVFETEGWRMSGFSLWQAGHRPKAMEEYASAIRAAENVPPDERGQTTLPLVFQDLLRMYDKRRADAIEATALRWQEQRRQLIEQAELRLPVRPNTAQVKETDRQLQLALEDAFLVIREEREKIISHGDDSVRRTVRLAREMLHPHWNGLPEIAHPFDAPTGEWQQLPEWGEPGASQTDSAGSHSS